MTVLVTAPSKAGSRETNGESAAAARRVEPSTDETGTAAGMTDFEEFAAALRAWADEIKAARTALDANYNPTPPASAGDTLEVRPSTRSAPRGRGGPEPKSAVPAQCRRG
jgi:hypothetical protein